MNIWLQILAHALTWTGRRVDDGELASCLLEAAWDIRDAHSRRRKPSRVVS